MPESSKPRKAEEYIQNYVENLTESRDLDDKIKAAINLGAAIGAEVGAEIGAEEGAKAAMRAADRERKNYRKQQYDRRLGDTKLLLRNYRRLNEYYENAIFDIDGAEEADEDFESLMRSFDNQLTDEEIIVQSIQRNFVTTKIIMTHVNKMLECYHYMCERSGRQDDMRHWRVLDGMYLSGDYITAEEIAKQENIDKRTVYRDIDVCTSDLAALFFGAGGLNRD